MPRVSVLYIDDPVVGPHLDLLRRVCNPNSSSRPHITVRYYDRLTATAEDLEISVDHIDLVGVGLFRSTNSSGHVRYTVYISCASDTLLSLEHKPHFPASELHTTIIDGTTPTIAHRLVKALRSMDWAVRVPLPAGNHLSVLEIKRRSRRDCATFRTYSARLNEVFRAVSGRHLEMEFLARLTWKRRLELIRAICRHLRKATANFQRIPKAFIPPPFEIDRQQGQDDQDIHVTPPELARSVASLALSLIGSEPQIHFGDPAVGNGTFFSALKQLVPPERIASAIGVEINSRQAAVAARRWAHAGLEVRNGDYLHMDRLSPRNLILANPPYLRHQRIPPQQKCVLRERASIILGKKISARSGQYVYFLVLSHHWLADKGLAAWLLPSEFMQTAYGSAVRYYLTHYVQLIRVHQFAPTDRKFENVNVMPSVVVFRKAPPDLGSSVNLTRGGSLESPDHSEIVPVSALRSASRWFRHAVKNDTGTRELVRLKQLFKVQRGIATGANAFFVKKRADARKLGIPQQALRPVLPKVRTLTSDIIDCAEDGYPDLVPQLAVIDCDLPIEAIKRRYPRFYRYLQLANEAGLLQGRLISGRKPWYKQERRDVAPFLCTYMGRGSAGSPPLKFIWNKSDAIATNTYLMLYPLAPLAAALAKSPELAEKLFALLRATASHSLTHHSRVYAGGLRKIEPGELMEAELPRVPDWLAQVIEPGFDMLR